MQVNQNKQINTQQNSNGIGVENKQSNYGKQQTYLQKFISSLSIKAKIYEDHLFTKILIGKYYIQAYRIFKILPQLNSIILWIRQSNKTHYNFLIISQDLNTFKLKTSQTTSQDLLTNQSNPIIKMKNIIQKMTRKPLQQYSITIALVEQMKKLNFSSLQNYVKFIQILKCDESYQQISKLLSTQPYSQTSSETQNNRLQKYSTKVECFVPKLKKQNQDLLYVSSKDFQALKQLISVYIDTFANQQKGVYIYKQIQNSALSFSVDILLNTINFIIFEQLNGSIYSQIQPCYWTIFQTKTKKLNSDRKHITLTGSGQICVLQIIFMKDFQSEDKTQYEMMLTQFKKFYKSAKIKIYRITNSKWNGQKQKINLQQDNQQNVVQKPSIIYKFTCATIKQF